MEAKEAYNPWADLVIAMLAVNNYPLERAFSLLEPLTQAGLTDPETLHSSSEAEIAVKLYEAGYERGPYMTGLFSKRLSALGREAAKHAIDDLSRVLMGTDASAIRELLTPVEGVGPRVLHNFLLLRGLVRT
ncbi:hypothetical protein N9166_01145 [bacterium]|nr:hypothetical protein [bacterium]